MMNTQLAVFKDRRHANAFMKTVKVISVQVTTVATVGKVLNQYFITYEEELK